MLVVIVVVRNTDKLLKHQVFMVNVVSKIKQVKIAVFLFCLLPSVMFFLEQIQFAL